MNSFFGSVLISTGDASRMTGYSSDYLLRLVRSGIVSGRKFGNTWFLSRYALEQHLSSLRPQLKFAYAEAQSETLSDHMRASQPAWLNSIAQTPLHEQLFALSVAAIVLFAGAGIAQTNYVPQLGTQVAAALQSFSQDVRVAVQGTFSASAPQLFQTSSRSAAYAAATVAATQTMQGDIARAAAIPAESSMLSMRAHAVAAQSAQQYEMQGIHLLAVLSTAVPAFLAHFDSLAHTETTMVTAYGSTGASVYSAMYSVSTRYVALVQMLGDRVYSAAVAVRDWAAVSPFAAQDGLVAVGRTVQDLTHAAIQADERLAFALAAFGPSVASKITIAAGFVGERVLQFTVNAPYRVRDEALTIAALPGYLGPEIAHRGFALEYIAAQQFTTTVSQLMDAYENGVQHTGLAIQTSIQAVFSATQQTVTDVRLSLGAIETLSHDSLIRGATASAAAVHAFSSATAGRR